MIPLVNGKCFGADDRWRKEGKGPGDKASGRGEGRTGSSDVRNVDEQSRRKIKFEWPALASVCVWIVPLSPRTDVGENLWISYEDVLLLGMVMWHLCV